MTMTTEDTEKEARRAKLEAEFEEIFANPGSMEDAQKSLQDAAEQLKADMAVLEAKNAAQAQFDAENPINHAEVAARKGLADFVRAAGAGGISVDDIAAHFDVTSDFVANQLEFRQGDDYYLPFQRLPDGRWVHYESLAE